MSSANDILKKMQEEAGITEGKAEAAKREVKMLSHSAKQMQNWPSMLNDIAMWMVSGRGAKMTEKQADAILKLGRKIDELSGLAGAISYAHNITVRGMH